MGLWKRLEGGRAGEVEGPGSPSQLNAENARDSWNYTKRHKSRLKSRLAWPRFPKTLIVEMQKKKKTQKNPNSRTGLPHKNEKWECLEVRECYYNELAPNI